MTFGEIGDEGGFDAGTNQDLESIPETPGARRKREAAAERAAWEAQLQVLRTEPGARTDYIRGLVADLNSDDEKKLRWVTYYPDVVNMYIADSSQRPEDWELFDQLVEGLTSERRTLQPQSETIALYVEAAASLGGQNDSGQHNDRIGSLLQRADYFLDDRRIDLLEQTGLIFANPYEHKSLDELRDRYEVLSGKFMPNHTSTNGELRANKETFELVRQFQDILTQDEDFRSRSAAVAALSQEKYVGSYRNVSIGNGTEPLVVNGVEMTGEVYLGHEGGWKGLRLSAVNSRDDAKVRQDVLLFAGPEASLMTYSGPDIVYPGARNHFFNSGVANRSATELANTIRGGPPRVPPGK